MRLTQITDTGFGKLKVSGEHDESNFIGRMGEIGFKYFFKRMRGKETDTPSLGKLFKELDSQEGREIEW